MAGGSKIPLLESKKSAKKSAAAKPKQEPVSGKDIWVYV